MSNFIESFTDSPISPVIFYISPKVHIVFPDMYIASATVTYFDYGLVTRVLKVLATKSNTTPDHLLTTLFLPNMLQTSLPITPKSVTPEKHMTKTTNTDIDIHTLSKLELGLEKTPVETSDVQNMYYYTLQKIAKYLIHPINKSIVINIHPTQPFSIRNIISTLSKNSNDVGKILPQIIQETGLTIVNP